VSNAPLLQQGVECTRLTFAAIPVGSQSPRQRISWVNTADPGNVTPVTGELGILRGFRVEETTALNGILTVRAFNGQGPGVQIYEATYDFATATDLTDALGADFLEFFDGCFVSLESDTPAMDCVVDPILGLGGVVGFVP